MSSNCIQTSEALSQLLLIWLFKSITSREDSQSISLIEIEINKEKIIIPKFLLSYGYMKLCLFFFFGVSDRQCMVS